MEAGGEGAGADLREHRYVERGDGSVRPRLAVQPKALTEPVWASAPFGHSEGKAAAPEARPRSQGNPLLGRGEQPTTPARAHRERRHAPHGAAASPLEWNPRRTVSAGASLDETGGVVPTPGRGGCFSGQSPRDLLPAKRSPVPSRRTSRGRGTPRTPRQRVAKPSPRRIASPAPTSSVAEEARQADETGMAALTSIPILRGLSNSERSALSQRLGSQTFAPGEDIITQGEEGDSLFIVSSGDAEAEVRGVGVVRQYTTGQWFGELALVTNQPRKATVRAVTSCTTLRLQRTDFERLIGKLGAHMEILRRRFVSAAYSFGRKDFSKLFRHYDRDNTGFLDLAQFRTACRKDGHVKVADVDDRELRCLYHLIDLNSDGKICEADWGHFLGAEDPRQSRSKIADLQRQRTELEGQCRAAMAEGTSAGGTRAKELLLESQRVASEIAQLEEDGERQERLDQQRVRAYRATAEQLKQYEAAREALQSKANDPSATLSVEMCEEMTALAQRVTEYRERLGDAHAELDKITTMQPEQVAAAIAKKGPELGSEGLLDAADADPSDTPVSPRSEDFDSI